MHTVPFAISMWFSVPVMVSVLGKQWCHHSVYHVDAIQIRVWGVGWSHRERACHHGVTMFRICECRGSHCCCYSGSLVVERWLPVFLIWACYGRGLQLPLPNTFWFQLSTHGVKLDYSSHQERNGHI